MSEPGRATFPVFGTTGVVLTVDPARLGVALERVHADLAAIDRACSRFREDSDLSRVNRAGGVPVAVGPVLIEALEVACRAARLTEGQVDPTVGTAMEVIGYDRDFAVLSVQSPSREHRWLPPGATQGPHRPAVPGRRAAGVVRLARVPGWRHLTVDRDARTVRVPAGVRLDLGATAKAWAADRAAAHAAAVAGCGVLVNLGGDLRVVGDPPDGGWRVRVADWHGAAPDAPGDLDVVTVHGGGLATSSTTVRTWRHGGRSVHHIVDPATSAPAEVVWRTVSVAAGSCVDATVAATAAIIRGHHAPRWLAATGLPARLVHLTGEVVHVAGWGGERAA